MPGDREDFLRTELARMDGEFGGAKHIKMAANPFVFMRGSASLFYADTVAGKLPIPEQALAWPLTTIVGDCHLCNFGFFTDEGSHGDQIAFAPNDFDDACIGPAAWDLVRYCASLLLCQDYCHGLFNVGTDDNTNGAARVINERDARHAMEGFLRAYYKVCIKSIKKPNYHDRAQRKFKKSKLMRTAFRKAKSRASGGADFKTKSSLAKMVDLERLPLQFRSRPKKLKKLDAATKAQIKKAFSPYMHDEIVDVVERINAGTGSVNMKRYYFLVGPGNEPRQKDLYLYHLVEVKQQRRAAALAYYPVLSPANQQAPAQLTVDCQRRMVNRPDLILDHAVWHDAHWLVRSRHHARLCLDPEDIGLGKWAVKGGFIDYAKACGRALALAHCRGDRRSVRFERAVAESLQALKPAIMEAAATYADSATADCARLRVLLDL